MYLRPGIEPGPVLQVRTRRRTRLRSAKTTGTGPFLRCGTATPWLRFGGARSPTKRRLSPAVVAVFLTKLAATDDGYYVMTNVRKVHKLERFYNLYGCGCKACVKQAVPMEDDDGRCDTGLGQNLERQ